MEVFFKDVFLPSSPSGKVYFEFVNVESVQYPLCTCLYLPNIVGESESALR